MKRKEAEKEEREEYSKGRERDENGRKGVRGKRREGDTKPDKGNV